jgi:hypothetical protein
MLVNTVVTQRPSLTKKLPQLASSLHGLREQLGVVTCIGVVHLRRTQRLIICLSGN